MSPDALHFPYIVTWGETSANSRPALLGKTHQRVCQKVSFVNASVGSKNNSCPCDASSNEGSARRKKRPATKCTQQDDLKSPIVRSPAVGDENQFFVAFWAIGHGDPAPKPRVPKPDISHSLGCRFAWLSSPPCILDAWILWKFSSIRAPPPQRPLQAASATIGKLMADPRCRHSRVLTIKLHEHEPRV